MKKRTGIGFGALVTVGALALAAPASAADCIPSPGKDAVPAVYETVVTQGTPGTPAVEEISHQEFVLERVTLDWFGQDEVPTGWTRTDTAPRTVVDVQEESHVEYVYAMDETQWSQAEVVDGWTATGESRWVKTADEIPATEEVSHQEYRFERTLTDWTEAVTVDGWVATGQNRVKVPAVDEVSHLECKYVRPTYATEYQYQKQVKGVVQVKGFWGWENTGATFDWTWWYSPTLTKPWTTANVAVLESGPHSDVIRQWTEGPYWNETKYREVSTQYQYVKNGQTRQGPQNGTETTGYLAASPGAGWTKTNDCIKVIDVEAKPAVYEYEQTRVEGSEWVRESSREGWTLVEEKKVVDHEATPYVPEQGYTEYEHTRVVETGWVTERPEGEQWRLVDERTVVDVEEVSHVEHEYSYTERTDWITQGRTAEYEGWKVVNERKVVDRPFQAEKPEVKSTSTQRLVTPAVAAQEPVVCGAALASTGATVASALGAALVLLIGGLTALIVSRRRLTQE